MNIEQNFIAYQQSITEELKVIKDRVRNLIGSKHWQSDGEHKAAVLRKVIIAHIAESFRVRK